MAQQGNVIEVARRVEAAACAANHRFVTVGHDGNLFGEGRSKTGPKVTEILKVCCLLL